MKSAHEIVACAKLVENPLTYSCHNSHIEHDVNGIRKLDADFGEGRTDRAHRIRNNVHRPSLHSALVNLLEHSICFVLLHPVIGGTCGLLLFRTDKRTSLYASHVVGERAVQIAAGQQLLIELNHFACSNRLLAQRRKLSFAAVDDYNLIGLTKLDAFVYKFFNAFAEKLHNTSCALRHENYFLFFRINKHYIYFIYHIYKMIQYKGLNVNKNLSSRPPTARHKK